ncbi:MAG TPA: aminotransferase class V-fold PLP-dependent enzyme [Pirellulales bacterium]|jgi:selenocysteine lyase/cysteine desulfurase|nr:aminotransferase class V-fold PLP-dependent enzyme [Pirellulales bacterium]
MTQNTRQRLREQMPVARRWAYFDHAAVAPMPQAAHDAQAEWLADVVENGDVHWPRWSQLLEQVRQRAAQLIGAQPAEIALVRNTTEGINLVAEGFPWQPGDNVVTLADEFPSNLYPWMQLQRLGVETRRVAVTGAMPDLSAVAAACDSRTRLVSISWVGYASGWRHDLAELCELAHGRGALLFVDAIQGLGVFPIDVQATPIDFLAADGHKWLLGPEGAGVFYLRREHLGLLRPVGVGWNSVRQGADFGRIELEFKDSAARYEGGTYNVGGLVALGASLDLLVGLGAEALAASVLEITDLACERLQSLGATIFSCREGEHRSGIVSFELPGRSPVELRKRCLAAGIALSCRGGRLRISPHAYSNADDIDRLIEVLEGEP